MTHKRNGVSILSGWNFISKQMAVDDEDKQRAILLSVCGSKTYKLIRNLITPRKPSEKTFAELVELVNINTQNRRQ